MRWLWQMGYNGRSWKMDSFYCFCPEEKIKAVTALYDKIGIGGICEEKINAYYIEGLSLLESIAVPSERKEELKSFVCHLMNRKV